MNYPSDQARTKLNQLINCLSKDKYVEISPYEKLWDFQSDQVKAKILSRALPFWSLNYSVAIIFMILIKYKIIV